jgi:hypothetical protein
MSIKLADMLGRLTRQALLPRPTFQSRMPCSYFSHNTPASRIPYFPRVAPSSSPFANLSHNARTSTTQSSTRTSFLRSFSTTRPTFMRPNYFPKSSSSGRGSPRPGPIRRMLIRLDSLPHLYIVCPCPYPSLAATWIRTNNL